VHATEHRGEATEHRGRAVDHRDRRATELTELTGGRLPPRSGRAHLTERPPAKRAGTGSKFRYAPDPRAREEYARRALRDKEREELSLKDAAKS
jgi:hypothetical protein